MGWVLVRWFEALLVAFLQAKKDLDKQGLFLIG